LAADDPCGWLPVLAAGRTGAVETPPAGYRYFVDFRAGLNSVTGHTYIVYGQFDGAGRVVAIQHADIFPEDENIGLVVGLFVPVRADVRVINGDSRRVAVVNYRRYLTEVQFKRMTAAVRRERRIDRRWNVLLFNCNDFAVKIAEVLGLRTPSTLLVPNMFVAGMRALNGRQG
jgi:hypothetical protein